MPSLHPGGTERLVLELVRRLQSQVSMAVCCLDDEGAWANELRQSGIRVSALGRKPGFHPLLGRALAAAASAHHATLMHCHHYSPFVYGCIARLWQPGVRVIFTEHGRLSDAQPSRKRRIANTLFARVPSAVFTVSDDLKRHIVEEGFSRRAVRVIHNGIDLGPVPDSVARERLRSLIGVPQDAIVVGTVARLDPVKDLGMLITAIARGNAEGPLVLLIVGDGSERLRLTKIAEDHGVSDRVLFLGHREDARDWLMACDIYANSSISEGVSLTILEAMAACLPVVATKVGGTPEVVTEDCGLLVGARDVVEMAAAIRRLAADTRVRHEFGQAARQRVERLFTLDRMVEDYRAAYLRAA